ncbi:hypothetical protein J4G48_0049205 (plasmid) [Bradyrhizobium barranii subsp. apii]|uniref:Uncharacterized protein n=1 Tax=Bradyrhizobium septentrionale TaxID=1404411 RepID=A0A973WAD0_9BRAD|nr:MULTISPECIES: hypothetical protein [Bradyrhizobium]UGY12004.1 hypothetical protein HAP48_0000815 [Bradyrhizobium septentrionale]UGY30208.1 hypothetical protein HU675_0048215 [Bradyrhizobium septentrionale]UPU01556.1 hypothetical protein J4G48_0049205 [Bradyrhizobium barranii subsp. apii]
MTRNARRFLTACLLAAFVARARKGQVELAADQFFNEFPRSFPHRSFDRIEPIVEKLGSRLSSTLREMRLRDTAGYGVVSDPAFQRRMIRG